MSRSAISFRCSSVNSRLISLDRIVTNLFEKKYSKLLYKHFAWLTEHTGNKTIPGIPVKNFDAALYALPEEKLEKMRTENDALETSINTSIDLNEIYEIATKELGMVYAKKDQVLLYDKTESEYVRQYEDIPEY